MSENESKSITRWDPFREFDLFEGWSPFRERLQRSRFPALGESNDRLGAAVAPAMDVAEDDEQYVLTAELPGTKKDDVTVELHENVLSIRGEKRNEREGKREQSRWVERSYGSFARSFSLPPNTVGDRISASFEEGVLTVRIPKAEERKPKVIAVKS